jgi:hypothetical protein
LALPTPYFPAGQDLHTLELSNLPAAQCVHVPPVELTRPDAQALQSLEASEPAADDVPAEHEEHPLERVLALPAPYFPAGHDLHTLELSHLPAPQSVHDWPEELTLPDGQPVQLVLPANAYEPAPQFTHVVGVSLKVLAAH